MDFGPISFRRAARRRRRWVPCGRRFLGMLLFLCGLLAAPLSSSARTLKEAFDLAGPQDGYDKYLELETGAVYTGGLLVGPSLSPIEHAMIGEDGVNVRIQGHGAILDLEGSQICISYCAKRLDIEDCVVLNGNIRFRGVNTHDWVAIPTGSVRHVTFYQPHDYGVRLQGAGQDILLERNLAVDAIDTGWDFLYTHGMANSWLPTGTNYSFSIQGGYYGTPFLHENWSWFSDPQRNQTPLAHFSRLCEYG